MGVVLHCLGKHDKASTDHTSVQMCLSVVEQFHSVIGWGKDVKSINNPRFSFLSLSHVTLKFCIIRIQKCEPF